MTLDERKLFNETVEHTVKAILKILVDNVDKVYDESFRPFNYSIPKAPDSQALIFFIEKFLVFSRDGIDPSDYKELIDNFAVIIKTYCALSKQTKIASAVLVARHIVFLLTNQKTSQTFVGYEDQFVYRGLPAEDVVIFYCYRVQKKLYDYNISHIDDFSISVEERMRVANFTSTYSDKYEEVKRRNEPFEN